MAAGLSEHSNSRGRKRGSKSPVGAQVRAAAAQAAWAVDNGRNLEDALAEAIIPERDLALLREMTTGTVRHRSRLNAVLDALMDRPLPPKAGLLRALLRVDIYQLAQMRLPPHAAVHATVEACVLIDARHARGLANAILRRYQREGEPTLPSSPAILHSHPEWMVRRLQQDWPAPAQWEALLQANNQRAPMTLRVATDRLQRDACLEQLAAADIEASAHPQLATAITLLTPRAVTDIPGFAEGSLSVQDAAAQCAAELLAPEAGERVLDACAAPGGKTGHLLESCPGIDLTAIDSDGLRLQRVQENLQRLGRNATLIEADAT